MKRRLAALAALTLGLSGAPSLAGDEFSPKLLVRTTGGIISNSVNGKSSVTVGGFNLDAQYFLNSWLAAGVGYRADFDVSNGIIPLKGFDIQGRAYVWGQGTHVTSDDRGVIEHDSRDRMAVYVLGGFAQRSYSFPVTNGAPQTGDVGSVDFGLGLDYTLTRHFEFNAELSKSLIGFSSDPEHVQLQTLSFAMGLGYVF